MRKKILTVDDSKIVRLIVQKTFKPFDCDIFEASNGVEGMAAAAKETPDIILLDVTMPVMDGVEMLGKLKADPRLKAIPVIMLTAESGTDNVRRIVKIGVRDYIVKPFKDGVLVAKVTRIIELQQSAATVSKTRSITDAVDILVMEDKPAIVQQIQQGLKHTPWQVTGVANLDAAAERCERAAPDLIIASLTLPDEAAYALFRLLRTDVKKRHIPIFGLVVKTDLAAQQHAQQVGFSTVITKPIDLIDLGARIAKALSLDTSQRYFSSEGDCLVLSLPEDCPPAVVGEISGYLQAKFSEAVDAGQSKAVIDLHLTKTLQAGVFKLLVEVVQSCRDLSLQFALVGNAAITAECRGFDDAREWGFHETLAAAKASLERPGGTPVSALAAAG